MKEPVRIAINWALGTPLLAGLIAWASLSNTPWWLQLVLAIVVVVLLGYLVLTSANWLFGPVLLYEVKRQTRSPRVPMLRSGYTLLLLLAMFFVYLSYTPGTGQERVLTALGEGAHVDDNQRAAFGATFFYAFMSLQFVLMLVFTPALIGGSIANERERGTLDLLLTTDLTNREIILGKLASQLGYLVMLLLTGLPILSLLQMFGGVDPNLMVGFSLATLLSLITIGAVSMLGATITSRVTDAFKIGYGFGVIHSFGSLFLMFIVMASQGMETFAQSSYRHLGYYACYNLALTCLALFITFRSLRTSLKMTATFQPLRSHLTGVRMVSYRPHLADRDPMVWKEIYYERGLDDFLSRGLQQGRPLGYVITVGAGILLLLFFVGLITDPENARASFASFWNGLTLYFTVPAFQILLIAMAMRGAVAFSRERDAQTYEALLTTTLSNWEIFRAKWLAAFWNNRFWALCLGFLYLVALLVGGVSPSAIPLALVAFAIHTAFAINLGLFCSVTCATTLRATITAVILFVMIAVGHWLIALALHPIINSMYGQEAANVVFNVHLWTLTLPCNLAAVSFNGTDLDSAGFFDDRLLPGLLGFVYYAGLALLFYAGVARKMQKYRQG